jgi:hypothetical protein
MTTRKISCPFKFNGFVIDAIDRTRVFFHLKYPFEPAEGKKK